MSSATHHHHHHGELAPAAESASVAIEVGPGRGALILYPSERWRGHEIEISRRDGDGQRVHTGVHERTTQTAARLTAVFGSLPAGDYVVWAGPSTAGPAVTVPEGTVAEIAVD
jgi:hypothetical protein